MLTSKDQIRDYVFNGLVYGYSECCIKYYHIRQVNGDMEKYIQDTKDGGVSEEDSVKLSGTGFICCPDCDSKYTEEELIGQINSQRHTSSKFSPSLMPEITDDDLLQVDNAKTSMLVEEVIREVQKYVELD